MIPINEKHYTRKEIPPHKQATFTSLLSSAGQGIVPASVRSGRDTSTEFKLPAGCKVELQIKAVYYEMLRCSVCGEEIVIDGQEYSHECKEELK